MLDKAAELVTNNPVFVLVGFGCSILGVIELIYSSIMNLKNKKGKEELDRKTKEIYAYLQRETEFTEASRDLAKAKEELERTRKQLEIDLPKEKERAILIEQIRYQEKIIDDVKVRLQMLKNELSTGMESGTGKIHVLLQKLRVFLTSEKTREFVILLLLLEASLFFLYTVIGGIVTRIFGIASIVVILLFAGNVYDIFKDEKIKKILSITANIMVCLYFFDVLLSVNITGVIWWMLLILFLCLLRKTSNNIIVDFIGPLVCIPLFIGILIFPDYQNVLLIAIIMIQVILIIINVIRMIRVAKSK